MKKQNKFIAFLLWLVFGLLGAHRFYLGTPLLGVAYIAAFICFGVLEDQGQSDLSDYPIIFLLLLWIYDFFVILRWKGNPDQVDKSVQQIAAEAGATAAAAAEAAAAAAAALQLQLQRRLRLPQPKADPLKPHQIQPKVQALKIKFPSALKRSMRSLETSTMKATSRQALPCQQKTSVTRVKRFLLNPQWSPNSMVKKQMKMSAL